VNRKRSCGHSFSMYCYENPEEIACKNKCLKALDCGHLCQRMCKENCNPCKEMVDKVVPHCGHTAKVPCGREPIKDDCQQKCDKKLAGCEHFCKANCADECTVNCREVVEMEKGTCGHEIKRFCFEKRKGLYATNANKF